MARVSIPPMSADVLDSGGLLTLGWRRFLEGLLSRTGGSQDITIAATSNTAMTFSYKGSDGVVRSGTVTLS